MAKRILSISYDAALLWTRQLMLQQLGYEVVSAHGFAEAWEACEGPDSYFDLMIVGHTVPPKDKKKIIEHVREHCDAQVLALLRPNEGALPGANRSVEADVDNFIRAVQEMLG